jgi:hypothetical protein
MSSRICIGFFGFIRIPITYEIFHEFKKSLPNNSIIDIFITCPNKVNEYDSDTEIIDIESKIIRDLYSVFRDCNLYIDIYPYEPFLFIKKSRDLGLPDYTTFPTYRIFSQHYSISRLSTNITKFARNNNLYYKSVILTRFDIIGGVKSFSHLIENIDKNIMYIWRLLYVNSPDSEAEDRIIISSIEGIDILRDLYEGGDKSKDIYSALYPEMILAKYVSLFPYIRMLPQNNIQILFSPFKLVKYSPFNRSHMNQLLELYAAKNLAPGSISV